MVTAKNRRHYIEPLRPDQNGARAIEDRFPFEAISDIAEAESWRKEVYRPIYHVHKWWAQRLGSVFRAAILGAVAPKNLPVLDLFYKPVSLPGVTVFDPFMGSGTAIGEALKLGCTVIGRDINPIAYRAVKTALGPISRTELESHFSKLCIDTAPRLRNLYQSKDSSGNICDVLYYFWVKSLLCPKCNEPVDLFSTFIFARNAYVAARPVVQVVCPQCRAVFPGTYSSRDVSCNKCGFKFDPHAGWARHTTATCTHCKQEFAIASTARAANNPPSHSMYAKLVLRNDGRKEYLSTTDEDLLAFKHAQDQLRILNPLIPRIKIPDGYNTRQILNYGYRYWHELFNERQLLGLTLLAQAISQLPESPAREALELLFSGALEFNNMFTSYKGEGTGAVRHMFSNHIFKPERMPIEANIWGTSKSSGAFSTLYRSRLLRAIEYREAPFEVAIDGVSGCKKSRKVFGLSESIGSTILDAYPCGGLNPGSIYLSCGSSTKTDLPGRCIDLVITDPPFFDNVHYSELADFFFVWQKLYFNRPDTHEGATTRNIEDVQDVDPALFADKLRQVFLECHRVLKDDGLMVFSYHHSREDGWSAIAKAVIGAGFSLVQSQPVKSEMSVAAPKSQAKDPIDLDVLLVCRKQTSDQRKCITPIKALENTKKQATKKLSRFNISNRGLSKNDVQIIFLSQLLVELSPLHGMDEVLSQFELLLPEIREDIELSWAAQSVKY